MDTGSPRYFSLLASFVINRLDLTCPLSSCLVFGLNIIDDLSLFITCLKALSYTSRICLSSRASLALALIKIKESSAKNRWSTLGAPLHIFIPSIFRSHSAFCNNADKPTTAKMICSNASIFFRDGPKFHPFLQMECDYCSN